jgi:hypothetical protein
MSSFKRFPKSIRYLIARLRHWTQPAVWAPLAVLCAGGFFIWEVSVNPERLSIDEEDVAVSNSLAATGLSADDSAIAAEIDSVPRLVKQLNRSNLDFGLLNSSVVKEKGLFDEIRDRGLEIPKPPSAPKQATSRAFLPLPSLANPAVGVDNNNPQNSSSQNSNATAALSPSSDGGLISGMRTPGPESGGTVAATLPATAGAANLGKQNENPVPLSPLQAAMKKYIAANKTSPTAASTQKTASEAKLLDRPTSTEPATNQANLLPTATTAQKEANPVNIPTAFPLISDPINTTINDSQQILNQAATAPESVPGLNLKVPSIPVITTQQVTPALSKNPYQTNLSGSGFAPESQPAALPIATPSPIPVVPNIGQSTFPSAIQGSKIVSPQFSPNSANSQFQPVQPSQPNLPNQPNFGVVPQNTNQGVQPIQPQSFSTPRSMTPGRYIGGGEINTFSNP